MGLVETVVGTAVAHPVLALFAGLVGLLGFLAVLYPDRAVGTRKRDDIPTVTDGRLPILGNTMVRYVYWALPRDADADFNHKRPWWP